ncbi:VanZ family protein [Schlesneria sp. T3-172]|uniref:VanZ family protein n=1 Tax=Schlesneria sphaerica TaxID=3373610 RepID=UPI0037CADF61
MSNAAPTPQSDRSPHPNLLASRIALAVLLIYWVALFYGTHTRVPKGLLPKDSDKLIHFWAYAGLGILLMSYRSTQRACTWLSVAGCWLLLALYGAFDELTQPLVNRNADLADWYCDIAGALVGLAMVKLAVRYCQARSPSQLQEP